MSHSADVAPTPERAIVSVGVLTASLPLAQSFQHASSGLIDRLEEVVVKVGLADGTVGWGEVRGNAPYVTGETQSRIVAALSDVHAPAVVATRPTTPTALNRLLAGLAMGNSSARAAVSIAAEDAWARQAGLPLQAMLGAGDVKTVRVHGTIPFCAPDEAARRAERYLDIGIRRIKQRVGLSFEEDVARMRAIGDVLKNHPAGPEAEIAADANQAWNAKEALRRIATFERLGLAFLEQPVRAADIRGLKEVRDGAGIPIIADESVGTPGTLMQVIEAGAADGFHFKLVKAGGPRQLMGMVAIAEAAGLGYMMGQMDEGQLATAAALHCAAASNPFSCELWGFQRVGSQPFSGLEFVDGTIRLPDGPGLGITIDEDGLTPVAHFGTPFA
ncbi:mandelate racemase/muconate lactonizing enzyme family protein [Acuticoccus mangrovi]|uniref:Mandelate racemase/muconate lactonizing enzyme C-terminal domain-containing protein n=1 Tax=Acuticoccus mangrovi TaxID=2796142 RepID=A0A934MGH1_9HYPH|nr:enolase C-terminal domain-like protein [Acuticoccus mangrovi]MBJ3776578.1 hypothetical protein [Acuticoccus mangrovi]